MIDHWINIDQLHSSTQTKASLQRPSASNVDLVLVGVQYNQKQHTSQEDVTCWQASPPSLTFLTGMATMKEAKRANPINLQ